MEKAIISVGREKNVETYQLIVGLDYTGFSYDPEEVDDPMQFLQDNVLKFAEKIFTRDISREVGILNGYKLSAGELNRIDKLPNTINLKRILKAQLTKLFKGKACAVIPIEQN